MAVDYKRPDYINQTDLWTKCRDVLEGGTEEIKAKGTIYLPQLPGQNDSEYSAYKKRAQFVNFSNRTLQASIGQLFRKNVLYNDFDYPEWSEDIDLAGTTLDYYNRMIATEVFTTNRIGVLVDYSERAKRPYLTAYKAETIINWRLDNIGGKLQPSLIVLEGNIQVPDPKDKFKTVTKTIWKELYLDGSGTYTVRDWEQIKDEHGKNAIVPVNEPSQPVINGQKFGYIPFYFITSDGLSVDLLRPVLMDLININLGHYINSADYENACHFTGANTIVTRGWGSNPFPVGGCADFPIDGGAEVLQAGENSMLMQAMKQKEEQMTVIGSAVLANRGRYIQSAETARLNTAGEYATLADISIALSQAMTEILRLFALWGGKNADKITVKFNSDFEIEPLNSQDLVSWMGAVQSGFMSWETFYYNMNQRETYPAGWTIEEEREAIAKDEKEKIIKLDNQVANDYNNNINKSQGDGENGETN